MEPRAGAVKLAARLLFGPALGYHAGRMEQATAIGADSEGGASPARVELALGLGLFALYAWTAAPGLAWHDAGELVAAAHGLGGSHPTGFPLWMLLGHAAALIPVGSVALRVTLLGAACTVFAALFAGRLAARLLPPGAGGERTRAQVVATLAVGLSAAAWRHATAAEVYGLYALCLSGALVALEALARRPDARGLAALGLAMGLALGGHGELRPMGLVLALLAWLLLRRSVPWRGWAWALAFGALGLAVHAYLPLRAAAGPELLWDDLRQPARLLAHLRAERIFAAFSAEMGQLWGPRALQNARLLATRVVADQGYLPLFAAGGLLALPRLRGELGTRRLALALALAACVALDLAYALWLHPMGILEAQVGLSAAWGVGALAGFGAALLARALRARPRVRALLWLTVALSLAQVGINDGRDKAHPGLVSAPSMIDAALASAAPHALLLVSSDSMAAGLLHSRIVERARPDLFFGVRQHLWNPAARRSLRALVPPGASATLATLLESQRGRREIRWEHGGGAEELPLRTHLEPELPLWKLRATPLPEPAPPIDAAAALRTLEGWAGGRALTEGGRAAWAGLLNQLGWYATYARDWAGAEAAFSAALAVEPQGNKARNNLGALASRRGDFEAARTFARAAVRQDPAAPLAQRNLGTYALALGSLDEAEAAYHAALALSPNDAAALEGLGLTLANRGDLATAAQLLRAALAQDPSRTDSRTNLHRIEALLTAPAGAAGPERAGSGAAATRPPAL